METIIIQNVPGDRLDFYRDMATTVGGRMTSVAPEDDGEFTVVIVVPQT